MQTKSAMPIRHLFFLGVGFAALRTVASAQNPAPPAAAGEVQQLSPFRVTDSADRGYLAANSVSATRIDTPIKELPFEINAFTEQFITDLGSRDLWDVVQYAPAVTSAGREFAAGNAVYAVRGFEQAPQRNGFTSSAYVDTVAVDRIEVVKGPASVLYGQVAPGGTVNYLTKRAQPKAFSTVNIRAGNDDAWRTTVDLNQPLAGPTLLARLNVAWENEGEYWTPMHGRSWVVAPNLVWHAGPNVTVTVDYQRFRRAEAPGVQLKPNTEIVAPPGADGVLATTGVLVRPDNSDYGIGTYYPLARNFNYASRNDYRHADFESYAAELDLRFGDHWVGRATADRNRSYVEQKLTGLAQVNLTVPLRYYPSGSTGPLAPAEYAMAARAFADDLLANPMLALDAPQAQQIRRKRLEEEAGWTQALQVEVAGDYVLPGKSRLRPLVGFSSSEGNATSFIQQSGGPGVPNFPVWDMKNPATWDQTTVFDPTALPVTTDTRSVTTNSAIFAVLIASLFDGHLSAVGGLRYNRASGLTDNYLAPATSVAKVTNGRTTPQLGVGYHVRPDVMIYASYSESFVLNAANLQMLSVPAGPAKPTVASGGEIGFKTDLLAGRISSTVAVFQIDQRDQILRFISFGPTGLSLNNTLQGTLDRSRGGEAEITWSPFDYWQVYASGAINDVRVRQVPPGEEIFLGTHPENTARLLANLWTRYTLNDGRAKGAWLGAGFNYTGRKAQRVNNPRLFLPVDLLWNATLGYDFKSHHHAMTATLNVQNLTNEENFPANQQRGFPRRITLALAAKY